MTVRLYNTPGEIGSQHLAGAVVVIDVFRATTTITTALANGARLGVLIQPESRTVEVYRPGQEPQALTDPKTVALDPELRGFVLELAPILEA